MIKKKNGRIIERNDEHEADTLHFNTRINNTWKIEENTHNLLLFK